ncbi:MAG: hypothetical protein AB7G93_15160 [Bdellovibrionales bacterium]
MFWNKLLQLIFGGSLMAAHTSVLRAPLAPAAVDEIHTHECARQVASLTDPNQQAGPVFTEGGLVFLSVEAEDDSQILVLSAGAGVYAARLQRQGVNKIRFEVPVRDNGIKTFFLTYMPGSKSRARYFDFSVNRPPMGRDELDFQWVPTQRAAHLLNHLEYALYQTADNVVTALAQGRLARKEVRLPQPGDCGHIAAKSPALAQTLFHSLNALQYFAKGGEPATPSDGPANVPASLTRIPASVR